jgi:hypothetical protein
MSENDIEKEKQEVEAQSQCGPMPRAERRHRERVGKEAESTYSQLCETFFRMLMVEPNPESEEFEQKRKSLNAKWHLYCQKLNFVPETHNAFDKYSKELIDKFKKEKEA